MKQLRQDKLDKTMKKLGHITKIYKRDYSQLKKRDWRTYEQQLNKRMKEAAKELMPTINQASFMIKIKKSETRGRKPTLTPEQKTLIILIKSIFNLSNRETANFLSFFTMMTGIEASYKTVERAYSDDQVQMIIHNMFMILVKRKKIDNINLSGDGTGYSLTITKHYRTERSKELKGKKGKGRKIFARVVSLMDLDTGMYVGYGTSMKSEKEAFDEAYKMLKKMGLNIKSARFDRYYTNRETIKKFGKNTKLYLIPKKNSTIRGSPEWKKMLVNFIENTFDYLKEYYRRENSEAGYSVDKRRCEWKVWQKRPERINTALMSIGVWHNLMLIG